MQKIRAVLRFLLGNLHDADEKTLNTHRIDDLCVTDAYMLHLLSEFSIKVKTHLILVFHITDFLFLVLGCVRGNELQKGSKFVFKFHQ